ncbi:MAG: AAA family ATPase, partial [Acidobacteriota bacterium]
FSTLEMRRLACEAEIRLNRRTAPSLYVRTVAVTRAAGGTLALGGTGVAVEWLVEMVRFDQATLFDRLAAAGRLPLDLMTGLADAIVRLHDTAARRSDQGGRDGMAWVVEGNAAGFLEQGAGVLDPHACDALTADTGRAVAAQASRLEQRRQAGQVRECHGDMHLRNICLVDGIPTLFDAVEFNDRISCVDVLYDVAFLLMDLWQRDLPAHASAVFNEYLTRTLDFDGLPLLPLFLSCRAAVRAKTAATAARMQPDTARRDESVGAARHYLALAGRFLQPHPPRLVAVGGWSGSGKSTLARGLGPRLGAAPGAVLLRSDVIRKGLLGVPPLTRLGPEGYSPEVTRTVYRTIADRARAALAGGCSVVADAVYASATERVGIEAVARDAGVPFSGIWLEGPPAVLLDRLERRTFDPSDATPSVLDEQRLMGTGEITWHRIDGARSAAEVHADAERAMKS